jgi:hypothetical protein
MQSGAGMCHGAVVCQMFVGAVDLQATALFARTGLPLASEHQFFDLTFWDSDW